MTEQRLQTALAKIDRWQARHPQGKPMSGLSIPAKYYFKSKTGRKARVIHDKKNTHVAAR
jgi:hypothetical protein